jgi:hypothetical protein
MPIADYLSQVAYPLRQPFLELNELHLVLSLPFNMQPQTQSNWCWAATSTSVSLFYNSGSGWTQCKVASGELGLSCCTSPVPGGCNIPWWLEKALTRTGNFVSLSGPISFADVQAELREGRVVGARIGWSGGGGHFMVIYGTVTVGTDQFFQIDDPIYGKSQLTVAAFSNNYQGSGSWTTAYRTKRALPVLKFVPLAIPDRWLELISKYQPPRPPHPGLMESDRAVGLAFPHQSYVLGLDSVVEGAVDSARPSFVRAFQLVGGNVGGFVDFDGEGGGQLLQMAGPDNPYAAAFERALDTASRQESLADSEIEPRLLRIPALYTDILWLKSEEGADMGVVVATAQDLPTGELVPLRDLLDRLKPLAEQIQADDDGTKGS